MTSHLHSKTHHDIHNLDIPNMIFWDGNYFGLERVREFKRATLVEKAEILRLCNWEILREIYFIEMAGVGYMSKLVSLAQSSEEQMLYSLFGAEEAVHLAKIRSFLPIVPSRTGNNFTGNNLILSLLESVPQLEDKAVLLFVLQVVLEGWSLSHYRNLACNCHHPKLSLFLQEILADESRHHAIGLKLFHRLELSSSSERKIIDVVGLFLQGMQMRQQMIVSAIEQTKGYLSRSQKLQIYEELDTETHTSTQLKFLRSLMRNPNSTGIIQQLEARGAFQAFSREQYLQASLLPSLCG